MKQRSVPFPAAFVSPRGRPNAVIMDLSRHPPHPSNHTARQAQHQQSRITALSLSTKHSPVSQRFPYPPNTVPNHSAFPIHQTQSPNHSAFPIHRTQSQITALSLSIKQSPNHSAFPYPSNSLKSQRFPYPSNTVPNHSGFPIHQTVPNHNGFPINQTHISQRFPYPPNTVQYHSASQYFSQVTCMLCVRTDIVTYLCVLFVTYPLPPNVCVCVCVRACTRIYDLPYPFQ